MEWETATTVSGCIVLLIYWTSYINTTI